MPSISINVPANRTQLGELSLLADDGTVIAGPFAAYAKADGHTATANGNPTRNPLLPFGDTPNGTYIVIGLEATGPGTTRDAHSYGPNGAIRLEPTSGDALISAGLGRQFLLIHGGDLNPGGDLRPTNGCVRLSDDDMLALVNAISVEASITAAPDSCDVQTPFVSVAVGGIDDGYAGGDPPPAAAPVAYPPPPIP